MRTVIKLAGAALALSAMWPSTAHAEWLEASSAHFVVYADDREEDVREFTEDLERYHSALEWITGKRLEPPSPSNRVTIYVVGSERNVQKLAGGDRNIGGFYLPRAGLSLAVVPPIRDNGSKELDFSQIVLLHEYVHHFMYMTSAFPSPRWMSEGDAEFFAAAIFKPDGAVGIGRPANHRAAELFGLNEVPLDQLFDDRLYLENRGRRYDSYYGRAWLLYHFMTLGPPERREQFRRYVELLTGGRTSLDAAHEAFGDFDQLDRDLGKYMRARTLTYVELKPEILSIGPIAIRRLSEGAEDMMPVRVRSKVGVDREMAVAVLADARKVAARYPEDPFVLAALAEAEYDAGNDDEAIAAADAALAIDPKLVNAYVQKGYALFRRAADADDPASAYAGAIKPFVALNRIENDHPLPLIYYHRSFRERGAEPPELALYGLQRAVELAPFDRGLRMSLAMELLGRGEFAAARAHLKPVAFDPHGGSGGRVAQALLTRLEVEGDPPTGEEIAAIAAQAAAEDEEAAEGGGA